MDDYFGGSVTGPQVPVPPQQFAPLAAAPTGWVAAPYPPPPPARSTGVKVLIGLVIGVAAIVAIGIVAAVVVPVVLNQRAKADAVHTTVVLPTDFEGMPQLADPASLQAVKAMEGLPGPGDRVVGAYGSAGTQLFVMATKYHFSFADQQGYLEQAESSSTRSSGRTDLVWRDVRGSELGGRMRCGSSSELAMAMCFFADNGAYGAVIVRGSPEAVATARRAREAVEHRT